MTSLTLFGLKFTISIRSKRIESRALSIIIGWSFIWICHALWKLSGCEPLTDRVQDVLAGWDKMRCRERDLPNTSLLFPPLLAGCQEFVTLLESLEWDYFICSVNRLNLTCSYTVNTRSATNKQQLTYLSLFTRWFSKINTTMIILILFCLKRKTHNEIFQTKRSNKLRNITKNCLTIIEWWFNRSHFSDNCVVFFL